jgi:hypothetical protein
VEFEKSFYRNLACGRTLQSAFDLARHQILVCPHIPPEDRQNETDKFCLLPLDTNHDVEIFYQSPLPPTPRPKQHVPPAFCPLPPDTFIGRELDQYRVLQALKRGSRLIRVSGGRGVGKSALVKSCCRYLNERLHVVDLHEILWIPYHRNRNEMPFSACEKILDLVKEHHESSCRITPTIPFLGKARQLIAKLVEYFEVRKTLLVIEATHFASNRDILRLCEFIEELLMVRDTIYMNTISPSESKYPVCSSLHSYYVVTKIVCRKPDTSRSSSSTKLIAKLQPIEVSVRKRQFLWIPWISTLPLPCLSTSVLVICVLYPHSCL